MRMPREGVPKDDLVRNARAIELVPDHGGAPLAHRLLERLRAGEREWLARDQVALVHELDFGAKGDAGEAAAPVAGRLAQEEDASTVRPGFQVARHVFAAP